MNRFESILDDDKLVQPDETHPLLDFIEVQTDVIEAPAFVVDDLVQEGVVVVAGASGSGKTTILVPVFAVAAGLCPRDYPLKARLTRRVIYVTEDPDQVQRILASFMRYSDFDVDPELVRDRFKIVRAHRMTPRNIVKVAAHYAALAITNQSDISGRTYEAMPVVCLDTTNASIDLDDENSNAEVGRAIALLKSEFSNIPVVLTGHTSKVNRKADVEDLSARGAGAWGADAHQSIFVVTDEHDPKARYLSLKGKKRFETDVDEIRFTSVAHQVMAFNRLGEPVMTWIRHAVPDAAPVNREKIREAAKAAADEAKLRAMKDRIIDAVQAHNDKGAPINRTGVKAAVPGASDMKAAAIAALVLDGALVEYEPDEKPHKQFGMALMTSRTAKDSMAKKYRSAKDGE